MAELLRLGPLGQMPNVSTYTILTLGFPIEAGSEQHVFSELKNAANKITLAYPWLAGQVVVKEKSAASSGTFSIGKWQFLNMPITMSQSEIEPALIQFQSSIHHINEKRSLSGSRIAQPISRVSKIVGLRDLWHPCILTNSKLQVVKRKAPIALLNGDIVSPAVGFANFYPDEVIKPVVYMQANFVKGGLLLTVCTHHCKHCSVYSTSLV